MTDLSGKNLPPGINNPAKPAGMTGLHLPLDLARLLAESGRYKGFSSNFTKVLFNWHEDCDRSLGS